jgi:hypothetical protein
LLYNELAIEEGEVSCGVGAAGMVTNIYEGKEREVI